MSLNPRRRSTSAASTDRAAQRGYTIIELVAVLLVAGVLAATAIPKFDAAFGVRDELWRDDVVAGLRYAHKSALSHRRLVCATLSNTSLSLQIAQVNNEPSSSCDLDLPGPSGSGAVFASTQATGATTSLSPTGVIYFQPDGRVTTDAQGSSASTRTITLSTSATAIVVRGETGHVE